MDMGLLLVQVFLATSSPHLTSFRQGGELGKCEEQQTAGGRWPCACEWGQLAEVPFSLCSGKLKMDPLSSICVLSTQCNCRIRFINCHSPCRGSRKGSGPHGKGRHLPRFALGRDYSLGPQSELVLPVKGDGIGIGRRGGWRVPVSSNTLTLSGYMGLMKNFIIFFTLCK